MTNWVDLIRRWVPRPLRYGLQRFVSLSEVKERWRAERNPLAGVTGSDVNTAGSPVRIGILRNRAQYHTAYVRACQEMGLPFRVLDLGCSDWLKEIRESGCGIFLAWPDATQSPWAKLYKDRCDVIEKLIGIPVIPSAAERWLYEDKVRTRDWLDAMNVAHPRTWVFTDRGQANAFVEAAELPLVFKTSFGAASAGVKIVRDRKTLRKIARKAFGSGHVPAGHDHRDCEWGRLFLQEYLPEVREWRLVRIGDAYFGHPKGRQGDFHSGSGKAEWDIPDTRLLNLLHSVTELGGFRSMAVDVFETTDGKLLVNELQTVFGASTSVDQMRLDGKPGKMIRLNDGSWQFEPGDFARNACANARIEDALTHYSIRTSDSHQQGIA
jgi:hypothetical protein